MKVALVCIAKDEDNYIQEWVEYHIKLGFDDVFVYQNNYRCNYIHPNLLKIDFDRSDSNRQVGAYNDFIQKNSGVYDYAAFFDIDEFLVLKKHNNIKDFLRDYLDYPAVGINWVLFGDNNQKTVNNGEYSCIKRFTKRQKNVNPLIKSIVKLNHGVLMSTHNPLSEWVCPNKVVRGGNMNLEGDDSIAQLNHYFVKTFEEFQIKMSKGRVCNGQLPNHFFDCHNFNEIEDLFAFNFFYN